ncbi:MAG: single-stranded-DNA-specific exonuclease RecJ [Firmicutes bacterium]|nr:single-stranded-DNA-specific exonuclease RecJ [Bacillota bacterium]
MKEWIYPEEDAFGEYKDADQIVADILRRRGIEDADQLIEFLSDAPKLTHDPFLMKNMKPAVLRIVKALQKKEKICIYGDYDADGVTATSLLLTVFARLTRNVIYYIPSRFDEGYGLNKEAMRLIAGQGVNLIITVDCGSVSCEEVELAKELGMDVIVTDHHSTNGRQTVDTILLNPKQEDCTYPFKELCGCGVAFKLAQALQRVLKKNDGTPAIDKAMLNSLLDLVAIGTVGDIVALQDENRTLVKYGLKTLNRNQRPGLKRLLEGVRLEAGNLTSENIAFIIVPHLNAAGRMMSAKTGVELLTSQMSSPEEAKRLEELVDALIENNKQRKKVQEETYRQCMALLEERRLAQPEEDLFHVIEAREAHEGITGIVAGKIKDATGKPTIIVTPSGDGFLKGTGRSIPGLNLFEMLSQVDVLFERFGGHAGACGFLMKEEHLEALRDSMNTQVKIAMEIDPAVLVPKVKIDAVITGEQMTMELVKKLQMLAPFGQKNPKPVIAINDVCINNINYMGDKQQHARFKAQTEEETTFDCVLFQKAQDMGEFLFEESFVSLAGCGEINVWNGTERLQFQVTDIQ